MTLLVSTKFTLEPSLTWMFLFLDVVGKVHKVGTLTQVKNGTITKRSVTIYDKTASSIEVTLWGALATNLPWKETEFPVLALKGVKVSDFSGKLGINLDCFFLVWK